MHLTQALQFPIVFGQRETRQKNTSTNLRISSSKYLTYLDHLTRSSGTSCSDTPGNILLQTFLQYRVGGHVYNHGGLSHDPTGIGSYPTVCGPHPSASLRISCKKRSVLLGSHGDTAFSETFCSTCVRPTAAARWWRCRYVSSIDHREG